MLGTEAGVVGGPGSRALTLPPLHTQAIGDFAGLQNFWKRFNKVHLEQLSLQCRHSQLASLNRQLRELLKQYLDGISVSDEVLSQLNPLFIVNYRSNLARPLARAASPAADRKPKATFTEADHVSSHSL